MFDDIKMDWHRSNPYLSEIIDTFGEQNERINEDELEYILDELQTIDSIDDNFELAKASILLGKPDILIFLLDNNDFNNKQLDTLKKTVEIYVYNNQRNQRNVNEILNIVKKFEKIITNYHHSKRKWD